MKTMMQPIVNILSGFFICLFIVSQLSFDRKSTIPSKPAELKWHAPSLPGEMDFSGEEVPLDKWDVRERFDRELLFNYYYQNNILFMLKLSNRYFPIIEERLKANGVPTDFKYLCIAESNMLPHATSRVGAVGFWQFMPDTAPAYGLEVSKQVDERREIVQATDAACKYLKNAFNKFGSWTAAAASYNCGQGGYASQAKLQRTNYYYDLLLPEETNRYIFRILAFKHILENAGELGFVLDNKDVYKPVKTKSIMVTSGINDLVQFAIDHGTNYKTLKLLNPWLRTNSLVVAKGKSYKILLPA